MSDDHNPRRRTVMAAMAALPLSGVASASDSQGEFRQTGSRILVAYFSRSGNTRVVAGLIHRTQHTDLLEIRPATPYPEDYLKTVDQARQERDAGYEPPLEAALPNLSQYETVYLGFPIWGETAPPVIRAFLRAYDLRGKNLIPFVTHGGYGLGDSLAVVSSHAPKAHLHEGFVIQADQERQTMNRVNAWLNQT